MTACAIRASAPRPRSLPTRAPAHDQRRRDDARQPSACGLIDRKAEARGALPDQRQRVAPGAERDTGAMPAAPKNDRAIWRRRSRPRPPSGLPI